MSLNAVKILGINVTISSKKEILEELEKFLSLGTWMTQKGARKTQKYVTIVTPNPEQIVLAQGDHAFGKILNRADVALPDGGGVVWAVKVLQPKSQDGKEKQLHERIPGVELMQDLVQMARKQSVPIALIGGRGNLAVKTLECLQREYPGLKGVGLTVPAIHVQQDTLIADHSDNLDVYFQETIRTLAQKRVQYVFVALGAPKQELFIDYLSTHMKTIEKGLPIIYMAVGGSFEIISGTISRAPAIFQRLRMPFFMGAVGGEWLWRLFHEPWRWKRQLTLFRFVWLVLFKRFTTK
jgi:N-acetylglucosaminyldiphosphoundecaprenol N-acetyl-beta-D-mannosaminyltransferase